MTFRRKLIAFQIIVIILFGGVIGLISFDYFHRTLPLQLEGLATRARMCVSTIRQVADVGLAARDLALLRENLVLCNPQQGESLDPDLRYLAILDDKGQVLVRTGPVPSSLPAASAASTPAVEQRPDGYRSGAQLSIEGKHLGSVWVEFSTERIQAGKRLFTILSTIGLLFTLLSAVVSVLFAFHVARPLRQMITFVHRVAKGDFEAKLEVKASDELDILAQDLNQMTVELQRSRTQLLQSEKMAAFGQLAAGVAHEINNPSAFIYTNLQQLRSHLRSVTDFVARSTRAGSVEEVQRLAEERCLEQSLREVREILDETSHGFGRIVSIVDNLRSFAHMGDRETQRFDLRTCLEPALRMVRNEIQLRGQLVTDLETEAEVSGNPHQLSQVFLNLLVNATQALEQGSYQENRVGVTLRQIDGWVEVQVSDTGCGISPEHLPKIFDPFFTTKARSKGTGLGLTISREIVQQHGGELRIESTVGRGTCFTVRLPLAQTDDAIFVKTRTPTGPILRQPARILLIDDETFLLRSFKRTLGRRHEVLTAESGEEALELIRQGGPLDIVVCDLLMPGLTGMEVYERVCLQTPAMKDRFLFMSGNAFTEQSRSFAERFKDRLLAKPFAVEQLEQLIQLRLESVQ